MEKQEEDVESIEKIETEAQVESKPQVEKTDILKMLSKALKEGTLSKDQVRHMRAEMGINESDFTKERVSDKVRKKKRKAQRQARKVTRQNGFKGQKLVKGQASGRGR